MRSANAYLMPITFEEQSMAYDIRLMMLPYGYPFEPNFSGTLEGKTFLYRYADTPKELQDKYIEASTNLTVAGGLGKMQFGSGPLPGGNGSGLIK